MYFPPQNRNDPNVRDLQQSKRFPSRKIKDEAVSHQLAELRGKIDKTSFWKSLILGCGVILAVAVLSILSIQTQNRPPSDKAFEQFVNATQEVLRINREILGDMKLALVGQPAPTDAKYARLETRLQEYSAAFEKRAAVQNVFLEQFRSEVSKPTDLGGLVAQFVTGGLVVGLLAFLGMTRLGNIDREIAETRKDLLTANRAATEDATLRLRAELKLEITREFKEAVDSANEVVNKAESRINELIEVAEVESSRRTAELKDTLDMVTVSVDELPQKYPFLNSLNAASKIKLASQIKELKSVAQAHSLAQHLASQDENAAATVALHQILDQSLRGSADELHNVIMEACRIDDSALAKDLAEYGLKRFASNADIAADYMLALTDCSEAGEAINFGRKWLSDNASVSRNWRFGSFLGRAYAAAGLSDDRRNETAEMFKIELARSPREPKLWSAYARHAWVNEPLRAYEIIDEGIKNSPTSQQLRFVKSEFLLEQGRFDEAASILRDSMRSDFQEQFQSDINGAAVIAHAAQAAEGLGNLEEARRHYQFAMIHPECHRTMKKFINARLLMLDVVAGNEPGAHEGEGVGGNAELLAALASHLSNGKSKDE